MVILIALLLLGEPNLIGTRKMVREIEAVMEEASFQEGFWGVAIYAPARGKFLYRRHPRRAFRPASNMKILTTLLAIDSLGADYRFYTAFNRTGPVRDGVLEGDLVVRGRGDPSLSGNYTNGAVTTEELLAEVTAAIGEAGIRHIRGDLVGITGFFDTRPLAESWEWYDVGTSYGTPVRSLVLHDGRMEIQVTTDGDGVPAVTVSPAATPDFQIISRLTHDPETARFDLRGQWGTNHFVLEGNLPPCSNRHLVRSVWDPAQQFLAVFRQALAREGISLGGQTRLQERLRGSGEELVYGWVSADLSDLAPVLMKQSQNHYADLFLRTVAAELTGEGSFDAGAILASRFLVDISADESLVKGFSMRDGSGLSAQDYLTPAQIVALLRHGLAQPYRRAWLASFPVMGRDGTLEERGNAATAGRVWAKTGYIYRSRCLSGYLETHAGEPLIFAMMVNNYGCPTVEVNRAQDRICAILLRLKPTRAVSRGPARNLLTSSL